MPDERTKHIASARSLGFWTVLILLSLLLVFGFQGSRVPVYWAIVTFAVSLSFFLYRARNFGMTVKELLDKGQFFKPYDYKKQTRKLTFLALGTLLAFILPFFLSAILGASVWLGSLVGIIDGWLAHLIIYNIYLLNWERANYGKLYETQIWSGSRVTHSGFTFEREDGKK